MASETVKEEKPIHKKAFEIYYSLGEERSIRRVAGEMNKSPTTIHNWSKSFNWKERVEVRDATVSDVMEKKVVDTVVTLKADYHKIIKATIMRAVEDIKNGNLKIESIGDLQKMIDLDLTLMGEEDRRAKGMMDELNNAITTSMNIFGNMQYDGSDRMDDNDQPDHDGD